MPFLYFSRVNVSMTSPLPIEDALKAIVKRVKLAKGQETVFVRIRPIEPETLLVSEIHRSLLMDKRRFE